MHLITHTWWLTILGVCIGGGAALCANMILFMMIGQINAQLPEADRIPQYRWGSEVRKKFKKQFPQSKLVFYLDTCVVVMVACFAVVIKFWVFS